MKRGKGLGFSAGELMEQVFDLVVLNLLFLLCCLPVVTVGASLSALHRVLLQWVRGDDSYHVRAFFGAFRREFWQSTILWLPMLAAIVVLYFDQAILLPHLDGFYRVVLFVASLVLEVFLALQFIYAFPLQARYANPVRQTVKNALLLGIWKFPYTICAALVYLILPVLYLSVPAAQPVVMILYLVCGFSVPGLVADWLVNRVFLSVFAGEREKQERDKLS